MKRLYLIFNLLLFLTCCQKEVGYDNPLSLSATRNELSAAAGSTPVFVFANDAWTASLPSGCDWAQIEKAEGVGLGEFIFVYKENFETARKTKVTVTCASGHTQTIEMAQRSGVESMDLVFPYRNVSVSKLSGEATVPFSTNIPVSEISKIKVSAAAQDGSPVSWISGLTVFPDRVCFTVDANSSDGNRYVTVTADYTDDFGEQIVRSFTVEQTTEDAFLDFDEASTSRMYSSMPSEVNIGFETNLALFLPQIIRSAESNCEWAAVVQDDVLPQRLVVRLAENKGEARVAKISASYIDNEGARKEFSFLLVQKAYVDIVSMEAVKALIPGSEGQITYGRNGLLEAVVISDCRNANVETNPNTKTNDIDFTLNWRTAYLQTADGTSGIRVVFGRKEDNLLQRGDKVYVDLEGLTLTKESTPTRFTLSGLTSANISVAQEKAEVVVRDRKISELADEDLYTALCLKGLEFTFKHGAYTNSHDGYQRALKLPDYPDSNGDGINPAGASEGKFLSDCTPCSLRDAEGTGIYALFNNETPWRRYGNGVPQGSCDINCILTHTDMLRWAYKGWLGRYQIRILDETDIKPAGAAFSKTVIEWNWGENAMELSRAEAEKPTTPSACSFYSITSNLDGLSKVEFNRAANGNMCDYNNLVNYLPNDSNNNKGNVCKATISWYRKGYFWGGDNPDDMSAAPWFCFGFSTSGLSGSSMVFNWTACAGLGWAGGTDMFEPVLWKVEYSTDGENFTPLPGEYAIHPVVRNSEVCAPFAVNGLHMYTTPLPASLLGEDKVYVRIKAASNKTAASSDAQEEDGGKITSGDRLIRFGEVSVQYN